MLKKIAWQFNAGHGFLFSAHCNIDVAGTVTTRRNTGDQI